MVPVGVKPLSSDIVVVDEEAAGGGAGTIVFVVFDDEDELRAIDRRRSGSETVVGDETDEG